MIRAVTFVALLLYALPGWAQPQEVNTDALELALTRQGFEPPDRFKALVGELHISAPGDGAEREVRGRWFDWRATSEDRDDWWPASSIKLYAAIAALERARAMGFSPSARLHYHYEDEAPVEMTLRRIIRFAIVHSNNAAFNRLVEFVGFDELNRRFFTARNGLGRTVFLRAYFTHRRDPVTGHGINRLSPRITIESSRRRRELPARSGRGRFTCPDQGNCTTLRELAESIRRVMMHEHLPESARFRLGDTGLGLLRESLEAPRREHGQLLVSAMRAGFGEGVPIRIFHKPGFAYRWSSDVVFVHRMDTDQRFIIVAAAWGGRRVIDDALERLSRVLASGELMSVAAPADGARAAPGGPLTEERGAVPEPRSRIPSP